MLRDLLILFCGLLLPLAGLADKSINLHIKPEPESKIIGAIRNTQAMVLLENQGKWAKVIDVETGMVGWLVVPDKKG
jgi:uncharacterized protein YgiM (DUF1202 family)